MKLTEYDEPSNGKIAVIENALRDDILWTVKYGPGWNPHNGARKNGLWRPMDPNCGVCAIASYCIRWQPMIERPKEYFYDSFDVFVVSRKFKIDFEWIHNVYMGIDMIQQIDSDRYPKARDLAMRLREYGDSLQEQSESLRHEAGIEDQLLAKKLFPRIVR